MNNMITARVQLACALNCAALCGHIRARDMGALHCADADAWFAVQGAQRWHGTWNGRYAYSNAVAACEGRAAYWHRVSMRAAARGCYRAMDMAEWRAAAWRGRAVNVAAEAARL